MTEHRKHYELLDGLPPYGPMYIPVSEHGDPFYSEGVVVRFYRADGTDWVANFEPGWTSLRAVFDFPDTDYVLVIARGRCYLMDPEQVLPRAVFGVDCKYALKAADGRLVLATPVCLIIVETDGSRWSTPRISWDGLEDLRIDGCMVSGLAYDPTPESDEWMPFCYDIDRREVVGGPSVSPQPEKKTTKRQPKAIGRNF